MTPPPGYGAGTRAWDTLPAMLECAADAHGRARLHFPALGSELTIEELRRRSLALSGVLRRAGVAAGDVVGLLLPTSPEFVVALFAIAQGGGVVAPLPQPGSGEPTGFHRARLQHILASAGIRRVVTDNVASSGTALGEGVELIRPVAPPGTGAGGSAVVEPGDLALVQYTSGSTARPLGAALTHAAVTAGIRNIVETARYTTADVNWQWLPLYHDMGLVVMLCGVAAGLEQYVWPPASFVRRPQRWLREFAQRGGTIYTGPNFSFDHLRCSFTPEEAATLDLSAWRVAFNGGEPIDPRDVEAFVEHFAPAGFRPPTMYPAYGLAEATLAVTFPPLGRAPRIDWVDRDRLAGDGLAVPSPERTARARGIVSVGLPLAGLELRVRNARGDAPERHVGEILVRGRSLIREYYRDAATTAERMPDGWLRTGDLGYLWQGELHVTGRAKQMIIVNGINFYPEDMEVIVREAPGVHRRRCVAVGLFRERLERMAVLVETALPHEEAQASLAAGLHRRVVDALELYAVDVHVVRRNTLRRTTSGKYQRLLMRDLLQAGELEGAILASYPSPGGSRPHPGGSVLLPETVP